MRKEKNSESTTEKASYDSELQSSFITHKDEDSVGDPEIINGRLSLYYDVRFDFESDVKSVKSITVKSKVTGTDSPDENVLIIDN